MFKKIFMASAVLAISSTGAYAATEGPYVGAALGANYALFKSEPADDVTDRFGDLGGSVDLFAGYGKIVHQNIYLGAELFTTGFSSKVEAYNVQNGAYKTDYDTRYSYGASFIPGILLTDSTLAYARLGVVKTAFEVKNNQDCCTPSDSNTKDSVAGAQAGLGLQTGLTKNLDVRGEYDFTSYRSFTVDDNKISPTSGQVKLGLVYKFD